MRAQSKAGLRRPTILVLCALVAGLTAGPVAARSGRGAEKRVIISAPVSDAFLASLSGAVPNRVVYRYQVTGGAAVAVAPADVDRVIAFANSKGLRAYPDPVIKATLNNSSKTVYAKRSPGSAGAWDLGYTGAGVTIGIIDSGIDAGHIGLNDLDDNPATSDPKVVHFRTFLTGGASGTVVAPFDDNDHGSHVSGIAAGTGDGTNGEGPNAKRQVGMARRANLAGFKVLDSSGSGSGTDILQAMNWIAANANTVTPPIRVVNISIGISGPTITNNGQSDFAQAVNAMSAAGVVVAVSAGNGSGDGATPNATPGNVGIPSDAATAISVCSSDSASPPAPPNYSDWDSQGPTADGRIKPDVCAPGDGIMSVWAGATGNSEYITFGGTSMSSPHVAGIAALIVQAVPTITPAQVRQVIYETAREYSATAPNNGKNNDRGFGEIQARHAIELAVARHGGPGALTADPRGPYSVIEDESTTLIGTARFGTPPYTYAWDLDNNGTFETSGQTPSFAATATPRDQTVVLRATDANNVTATATTVVTVLERIDILDDDVESPTNDWTAAGGTQGVTWHRTTVRSNSPQTSWYVGDDATQVYTPLQSMTLTRNVDLSTAAATSAQKIFFRFARSGSIEPTFDFLRPEIKKASDGTFVTLAAYDNFDGGDVWENPSFDITSYKGFQINIRFRWTSDSFNDVPYAEATGPFVDDIMVTGVKTPVPPPETIVISPDPATIQAGQNQTFTAEKFDAQGNSLGDVTNLTTFTVTTRASCSANLCGSTTAGTYTVTGTLGTLTDTASLTVTPGPLDALDITPATAQIIAGQTQAYAATGTDQYGNSLGNLTASTIFSAPSPASCAGNLCGSTTAATYTITGSNAGKSDTASLTVAAGPLASIEISPPTATITAGGSQPYSAEGFDQYGNSLGTVTGATTFSVTNGTCTGSSCTSNVAGVQTVTGDNAGLTDTASLEVNAGPLDHLSLSPATASVVVGNGQSFTAQGRDAFNNPLGDVTGSTTFEISPSGSCIGATCKPDITGDHTVTGRNGTATGTALLRSLPRALARLEISPSTATIPAGSSQPYTSEGFDQAGVSLGNFTGVTMFTIAGGQCTANVCRATTAGGHEVTGSVGQVKDTALLTIVAGPIVRLGIAPAVSSITPGGTRAYAASGFDAYNNLVSDVTSTTTFTVAPEGSCSGNVCTASAYGRHTVTGTRQTATGSATLNVVPAAPVIVRPPAGSMQPATVEVSGTAPLGTTVSLYDNGSQRATGLPVDGDGRWSTTLSVAHGAHTLTAYASIAGFTSNVSAGRTFNADALAPTVTYRTRSGSPVQTYHPLEPVVVEGFARDPDSGTATVEMRFVRKSGQVVFFDLIACATGCSNFRFSTSAPLEPGVYDVLTQAVDRVGNRSAIARLTIATTSVVSGFGAASRLPGIRRNVVE